MKKAQGLPVNTIILLILALVILVLVVIFYSMATGKSLFPAIMQKIKFALGMWNATAIKP